MPPAGFEPAILAIKKLQTYAIEMYFLSPLKYINLFMFRPVMVNANTENVPDMGLSLPFKISNFDMPVP